MHERKHLDFKLPLSVPMGKYKRNTKKHKAGEDKKPFRLNLNNWRNANPFLRTKADKYFREIIRDQYKGMPQIIFKGKISIQYKVYFSDKRKKDISNILSIIDKYFSDAIVELGVIPDDNYEHLVKIIYEFGGIIDEEYCEVIIKEVD